jgi:hypothetical protein
MLIIRFFHYALYAFMNYHAVPNKYVELLCVN